jgi:hypothetical protein
MNISCSKDEPTDELIDLGYNYYPLDSGWIRIYQVDSISFNDNTQTIDTFRFTLIENTSGKITGQDLAGHQIINRLVQTDTSAKIQNRSSLFVVSTSNNLQVIEDNLRIVKLVFPLGNVSTWNGNMMNNNGRKTFALQNIGASFTNNDTTFKNCITVQEAQTNNLIEEILIKSVYCKNLGLVDFTNNYINTQQTGKSGYKVRQQLKYYYRP